MSSPRKRRASGSGGNGSAAGGHSRPTLDLVKELAELRDSNPVMFPAAYERLKAKVPDVDNIIRCFPPNAPPAVASEEPSGFLEDGSFEGHTLTSLLPSPPSPPAAAAAGAPATVLGTSGAAIRGSGGSSASSFRSSQRRRAAGNSVGVGGGSGGGAYGRSSSSSNNSSNGHSFNRDALDVSSISGIARLDDDHVSISNSNGSGSGNDNSISASFLASDDVLLRARAIRGVGGRGSLGSLGGDDDRNGSRRGGPADAKSSSRTARTLGRSNSSSAADARNVGDGGGSGRLADSRWSSGRPSRVEAYFSSLDPGRSNDTTTTTSSTAVDNHAQRIEDVSNAASAPRRHRAQPSEGRPASSTHRATATTADPSVGGPTDANSHLYPTVTISPVSPLSRGGRRRAVHRAAAGASDRSSRSRLSRSSGSGDATAAGLSVQQTPPGRRPLRGARDEVEVAGRSADELESVVFGSGVGDGLRGSGERSEGLGGVEDSPGSNFQHLLSELPSKRPDGMSAGGRPLDVKDARCVCFHQPIVLRSNRHGRYLQAGKRYMFRKDKDGQEQKDKDNPDENASIVSVPMEAPGTGGGSSSTVTGSGSASGEGSDADKFFSVNADGAGTGDPLEVVHFVSGDQKADRGPLVYGEAVGIRSYTALGKYLRILPKRGVFFMSTVLSKGERWIVLPHEPVGGGPPDERPGGDAWNGGSGATLAGKRRRTPRLGTFVRTGELIELRHQITKENFLIMRPVDCTGAEWEVTNSQKSEYTGDDYDAWEIVPAGVPHLPAWRRHRPYLTMEFLLEPPQDPRSSVTSRLAADLFDPDRLSRPDIDGNDGAVVASGEGFRDVGRGRTLGGLPEAVQEQLLLDDLLSALMGFPGSYIVVKGAERRDGHGHEQKQDDGYDSQEGERDDNSHSQEDEDDHHQQLQQQHAELAELQFTVEHDHQGVDESLSYLAQRLLPLCDCYVHVNSFALERSQYEFGKVAHALSAAIRRLLREYLVLIAQLENQLLQGKLSLQRLWFYVQPSLTTMRTLDALTMELKDMRGGELLRTLKNLAGAGGDEGSRKLHTFLLHEASVPYLEMLETWIYHGNLNDQYGEFMVAQIELRKETMDEEFTSKYWSDRYQIQPSHVISSLAGREQKILTTGKYLNVVRESGRRVDCPLAGPIPADPGPGQEGLYAKAIDGAYGFASRCLMDLVFREGQLVPRLESIKHYFLLDRGDFFEHFMDVAEGELDNVVPRISVSRLESLLHLSVQMSSASHDPFKDELGLEFCGSNLVKHLEKIHGHGEKNSPASPAQTRAVPMFALPTIAAGSGGDYFQRMIHGTAELRGVEALMMSYTVQWPLSLVLSKKTLTKFQLIFRQLFFAKHVQRLLSKSWREHQDTKELELKGLMMHSYHLRQRMLHFMQNLVYYMMVEVIEPRWHQFRDKLHKLCPDMHNINHNHNGDEARRDSSRRPTSADGGSSSEARGIGGTGGVTGGGGIGDAYASHGTLDDVLKLLESFQDACLTECLLTNVDLLKSLTRVMISCLHFGDQGVLFAEERRRQEEADRLAEKRAKLERQQEKAAERSSSVYGMLRDDLVGAADIGDGRSGQKGLSGGARTQHLQQRSSSMRTGLDTDRYRTYIRQSQEDFDASLNVFAGMLWRDAAQNYGSHLNNLCTRLDFNEFFTQKYGGKRNSNAHARPTGEP